MVLLCLATGCRMSDSTSAHQDAPITPIWGDDTELRIGGARVSTPNEAKALVSREYHKLHGARYGLRSSQEYSSAALLNLGYSIPGFAEKGDRIWEVRTALWGQGGGPQIKSLSWVNPHTGAVRLLTGVWEEPLAD